MLDSVLFSGTNKSPSPSSGTKTGFPWHVTVGSSTPEGQGCLCRHQRDLLTTGSHSSRSHSSAEGPAATVPGPSCLGQGAQGSGSHGMLVPGPSFRKLVRTWVRVVFRTIIWKTGSVCDGRACSFPKTHNPTTRETAHSSMSRGSSKMR